MKARLKVVTFLWLAVLFSTAALSKPSTGGSSGGTTGGSTSTSGGSHIIANPNDYFLTMGITLKDSNGVDVQYKAGTRWYTVPNVERLRNELVQNLNPNIGNLKDINTAQKVVFGYDIMTKTYQMLGVNRTDGREPLFNGQLMNCSACHAQGGTVPHAWPLFRTATHFSLRGNLSSPPGVNEGEEYGPLKYWRDTITVNKDCGINCAGEGEIPNGTYEMDALVAWTYAVRDGIYADEGILIPELKLKVNDTQIPGARIPVFKGVLNVDDDPNILPIKADPAKGKVEYDRSCASCHGKEGLGKWSFRSGYTVPPVAGSGSHTKAGGPYMVPVLAAFIKRQMPLSQPGSLTEQQAIDISAYINGGINNLSNPSNPGLQRESRWWEDYYYEHNPCGRTAYLPLDVGAIPAGFPFTENDTRYGPWKPIHNWLKSDVCTKNNLNLPQEPLLHEDFNAGFDGTNFVKPAGTPEIRR